MTSKKLFYYAITPAGTLCIETKGESRAQCIKNLLNVTSHMPYESWEEMKERGYTIEQIQCDYT